MSKRYNDDWFDDWEWEEEPKTPTRTYGVSTGHSGEDDWDWGGTPDHDMDFPVRRKSSGMPMPAILAVAALLIFGGLKLFSGGDDTQIDTPPAVQDSTGLFSDITATPTPTPNNTVAETRTDRYFARKLTPDQKQAYYQILDGLMNCDGEIKNIHLPTVDQFNDVVQAVFWDYAELFWFTGAHSSSYYDRGSYLDITMIPDYRWDRQTCLNNKAYVESASESIVSQLAGKSEYAMVKGVYEYLIDRTAYTLSYRGTSIYELFSQRKAVCEGYARATQYLLTKLGVECIYVVGYGHTESHAWNIVRIDGEYYQVDTTWGDPLNDNGIQTKNFNYLCLTDEEIRREHRAEWSDYPACTSTRYNYYVCEGNYLTSYDMNTLKQWAMDGRNRGGELVFKVSNEALYRETVNRLINQKEMWTMLEGLYTPGTTAYHTLYDDLYIIKFTWQ